MIEGLGPQVAIVDDRKEEVNSILKVLDDLSIGNRFFMADSIEPQYPDSPLLNVDLVFLDLFYSTAFGTRFEPEACLEWINRIVPPGKEYALVVWSRDTDHTEELMEVMKSSHSPIPLLVETKQKNLYQIGDGEYDIKRLLREVNLKIEEYKKPAVMEFHGQVIELEDDHVLIKCLMDEVNPTFQVRRFDAAPLSHIALSKGTFLKIKITTLAGSRKWEFIQDNRDLKQMFEQEDHFSKIRNSPIINPGK